MRTWLMLLSLLLLQGCSAIKLGYQQLPTLSYWWLDSTVSFNTTQTATTKQALEHLHQWHRSEELPAYADLLQRVQALSAGPVQTEQVCRVWADVQIRLDVLMREAVVQAAPVAMALGPKQLSHIARRWESQNEDWEKEWLQGSAVERLERVLVLHLRYEQLQELVAAEGVVLLSGAERRRRGLRPRRHPGIRSCRARHLARPTADRSRRSRSRVASQWHPPWLVTGCALRPAGPRRS